MPGVAGEARSLQSAAGSCEHCALHPVRSLIMRYRVLALLLFLLPTLVAADELTATTPDGRVVLLNDDGTWQFLDKDRAEGEPKPALLTLEDTKSLANGCTIGVRLHNRLPDRIRSLVLRFIVYKEAGVPFDKVSRGFSYIKPSITQYRDVTFRSVRCEDIVGIEVRAARNCHVGELTKYTATPEHCLKLIEVAPSDIVPFGK
jgi:hypothetical protein